MKGIPLTIAQNKQVRKRSSYCFWRNIVREIKTWGGTDAFSTNMICEQMWRYMDDRWMFNTQQQAKWDKESMQLAVEDFFQELD